MTSLPRRTPYYHKHAALGAEFVDRFGFAAAHNFGSVEREHRAAREAVGLFDVYGQFIIDVQGRDALALVQHVIVNDAARLKDGGGLYTSVCNQAGGIIDDLTLFRVDSRRFWFCPTPSRVAVIESWLNSQRGSFEVSIVNLGYRYAYLSVQGPNSRTLLGRLTDLDLSTASLPYYSFRPATVADVPGSYVSRTGYSGELGFELFYPSEYAEHLWDRLVEAGQDLGVTPCGLGSLASLRLEKKYPLYGLDLTEAINPIEAGLGWTVRLDKGEFIGRDALAAQKAAGPAQMLALLVGEDLAAQFAIGETVMRDGTAIGRVTSAAQGYSVGRGLAMALLSAASVEHEAAVSVTRPDGTTLPAAISTKAVYEPDRARLRD
jgi:aminomethyltransferase